MRNQLQTALFLSLSLTVGALPLQANASLALNEFMENLFAKGNPDFNGWNRSSMRCTALALDEKNGLETIKTSTYRLTRNSDTFEFESDKNIENPISKKIALTQTTEGLSGLIEQVQIVARRVDDSSDSLIYKIKMPDGQEHLSAYFFCKTSENNTPISPEIKLHRAEVLIEYFKTKMGSSNLSFSKENEGVYSCVFVDNFDSFIMSRGRLKVGRTDRGLELLSTQREIVNLDNQFIGTDKHGVSIALRSISPSQILMEYSVPQGTTSGVQLPKSEIVVGNEIQTYTICSKTGLELPKATLRFDTFREFLHKNSFSGGEVTPESLNELAAGNKLTYDGKMILQIGLDALKKHIVNEKVTKAIEIIQEEIDTPMSGLMQESLAILHQWLQDTMLSK